MSKVKAIRESFNEEVKINLGGKERTLKFDLNAFAELENRFGSVQKAMEEMKSGGMKAIKIIVWAGLIHAEAVIDEESGEPMKYNISPYQVGSWLMPGLLAEVSEKLSKAIMQSMPDISDVPGAAEELAKIQAEMEASKEETLKNV